MNVPVVHQIIAQIALLPITDHFPLMHAHVNLITKIESMIRYASNATILVKLVQDLQLKNVSLAKIQIIVLLLVAPAYVRMAILMINLIHYVVHVIPNAKPVMAKMILIVYRVFSMIIEY